MTDIVTVYTVEKCYACEGCDCTSVHSTLEQAQSAVKAWMLEYFEQYDELAWLPNGENCWTYEHGSVNFQVTAWTVQVEGTSND